MIGYLLVCLGAAVGAPARYLTDRFVQARHDTVMPWGTMAVNLIGCFVLGVLAGLGGEVPKDVELLAGTGFCGALTTYSTFSYETLRLSEEGAWLHATFNVLVSVLGGFGAAVVGFTLGVAI